MQTNIPKQIYVHHTAVSRSKQAKQFLPVNDYHKKTFGDYCKSSMGYHGGYTIFIEPDGTEYRYREDNEETCATKGYNTRSVAVCLAGHFDIEAPTDAQIATLKTRIKKWQDKYDIPDNEIYPHRAVANKTCYGSSLPDNWVQKNVLADPPEDTEREKEVIDLAKRKALQNTINLLIIEVQKLIRQITNLKK